MARFKEGLWPLWKAGRLGCLLMQFPWSFRYTEENRQYFIRLRRTFHEFPLAAEMRHATWMTEEALGTFIDYQVAFSNIDQPPHMRAIPPTALITSPLGYVRLHGRASAGWFDEHPGNPAYLYTPRELADWRWRIEAIRPHASSLIVITTNDVGGASVVNALELSRLLGSDRQEAPPDLLRRYPERLAGFTSKEPVQQNLFPGAWSSPERALRVAV